MIRNLNWKCVQLSQVKTAPFFKVRPKIISRILCILLFANPTHERRKDLE